MMKRLYITLVLAVYSLTAALASIPVGSTVYIDCSQYWCCASSYLLYSSSLGKTFVMTPVAGYSGVYSWTATVAVPQNNINFGYGKSVVTADFSGWFGGYVSKNKEMTENCKWTAAKPYYIVTADDGSGYWAEAPVSTGVTALNDVRICVGGMNCIDSTYSVTISVDYTGAPCALKISSDILSKVKTITNLTGSPYEYTIEGLSEAEGNIHSITVALYSDAAATTAVGSKVLNYTSPARECTEDHGVFSVCVGDEITLTSTVKGEQYKWSNGDTARSITVTVQDTASYMVRSLMSTRTVTDNLMANGDFESNPPTGFVSDYTYYGWDLNPLFGAGGPGNDHSGLYIISSSAKRASYTLSDVMPHSGQYFGLFDADKSGDAWRATTAINPSLVVIKDSTYHFSFWAANINTEAENGHPAVLQFRISLDGGTTWTNLGSSFTPPSPGADEPWGYSEVLYKAPQSSNNVAIAVSDLTSFYGVGNDFALDDIMFQLTTAGIIREVKRDIYHVKAIHCAHHTDTICAGDTYTGHGYNQEFPTAGDYELNTGDTVFLHVVQPVEATFTAPASLCNFDGSSVDVSYTVTAGSPDRYSLSFSDSRFAPVTDAPLPAGKIAVVIPEGVSAGTFTVNVTLSDSKTDCPYEGAFTLVLNDGIPMYVKWNDVIFVDNSDSLFVAYQWYCDGQPIEGATKQYLYDPNGLPGTYFVEITSSEGSVLRTCESTFADLQRSADLNPGDGAIPVYETRIYQVGTSIRIVQTIYEDGSFTAQKQIIR